MKKAILVGISLTNDESLVNYNLDELENLINTLDIECTYKVIQKLSRPNSKTVVGPGKIEEINELAKSLEVDYVIFDDELTPSQLKNIDEIVSVEIMDRSLIILNIFEERAQTKQAKLEVKLAKYKYLAPRLRLLNAGMDRQGGGDKNSKGSGETNVEIERRRIQTNVLNITAELNKITKRKLQEVTKRKSNKTPIVALVGYTNAGKSSTMNNIIKYTNAEALDKLVFEKDQLFATLSTSNRRVVYDNTEFILVDTVGFVNKLPHHLINSFKSTLEETKQADYIIQVVDAHSPYARTHIAITDSVISSLGANEIPEILLLNKSDLITEGSGYLKTGKEEILHSNKNDLDTKNLLDIIVNKIREFALDISLMVPYTDGKMIATIDANEKVNSKLYVNDGVLYNITITPSDYYKYSKYEYSDEKVS